MTHRFRHATHATRLALPFVAQLAGCSRAPDAGPEHAPAAPSASANAPSLTLIPGDAAGRIVWPTPAGWEHETIPFPPEFAPGIRYDGVEELRFAPGFYKPEAAGYWSYDLVWWLSERPRVDVVRLESDLTAYFRGLSLAVGKARFRFDTARFSAKLVAHADTTNHRLTGRIQTYDPFTTGQPLVLNAVIESRWCPKAGRYAVTLMLSPQAYAAPIWNQLRQAMSGLVCV